MSNIDKYQVIRALAILKEKLISPTNKGFFSSEIQAIMNNDLGIYPVSHKDLIETLKILENDGFVIYSCTSTAEFWKLKTK